MQVNACFDSGAAQAQRPVAMACLTHVVSELALWPSIGCAGAVTRSKLHLP